MAGVWKALPGMVVGADTIVTFERLLDRHACMQEMVGYASRPGSGDYYYRHGLLLSHYRHGHCGQVLVPALHCSMFPLPMLHFICNRG